MLYRVAVELRDLEKTVYFEAANASEVEALTARIGYGEIWDRIELVAVIGQVKCPEHGWSLIDAGGCAECLDEYYHPRCEEECV